MSIVLASLALALPLVAAPPPALCRVEGVTRHLEEARVAPPGAEAFTLLLDGVEARTDLVADAEDRVVMEVTSPLVFTARLARERVVLSARRTLPLADGRLVVTPRTVLEARGSVAGEVLVVPAQHDLETLEAQSVGCGALTFGDPSAEWPTRVQPPAGRAVVPTGEVLELFAGPTEEGALRLGLAGVWLMFERLAERGGRTKVRAAWSDGTVLMGWARSSAVHGTELRYADLLSATGFGGCGIGVSHAYHGPAVLHAGAEVHEAEGGVAWATVSRSVSVVVVGSEGWVQLVEVPGLGESEGCRILARAWVQAEDLTYPPAVRGR